ncbi:MAG: DUF504 domain-containing protein [Methermicoccaceae archaeon]
MAVTPREHLNRIKWSVSPSLEGVRVWYVHRGTPSSVKCVEGGEIERLDRGLFVLRSSAHIPYHRVFKIEHNGKVVYYRQDKEPS